MLKRLFDILCAALGLLLLSPIFLMISAIVGTTSPGGIFFRQERIGRDGRVFFLNKFRTMLSDKNNQTKGFDLGHSKRVTTVGSFLRKTKLDELPQLWNVLIGDMSLVGPRPEVVYWVNEFPTRWTVIHKIRPGITDEASIQFRNEENILTDSSDPESHYRQVILPRKLDLAEHYANSHTFLGDLSILSRSVWAVISGGKSKKNKSESTS